MNPTQTTGPLGRAPLSSAVEDYLKAIHTLAAAGLAHHTPYRGIELSETGERIAVEVVRHHRIIETFLLEVLGLDAAKVHAEAERWEHVLSEEVEALMMAKLGHPTKDPHGKPIPATDELSPGEA